MLITSLLAFFSQLAVCLVTAFPPPAIPPTEPFTHYEVLDAAGHFHLFWKHNPTIRKVIMFIMKI